LRNRILYPLEVRINKNLQTVVPKLGHYPSDL